MEKEKEKGEEREEREKRERERFAPALIAATTAGPVGHAQWSRACADEATGYAVAQPTITLWLHPWIRVVA